VQIGVISVPRPKKILEMIIGTAVHVSIVNDEAYGCAGGTTLKNA
jgi:hypothetical protein